MYMHSVIELHVASATKTWAVHDIMKQVSYILVSVFDGPWNFHNLENIHLAVGHTSCVVLPASPLPHRERRVW